MATSQAPGEASLAKSWSKDKEKRANKWWQFSRSAKELYAAIEGSERVLVNSGVSSHVQFAFLPAKMVFARATLMVKNNEGLTKTYNRFHDPDERYPEILKLRELHVAMDHAVLDAYGWSNIETDCEFLLDYEIDEEEWSPHRKRPYRYRWPDEVRDEVLARLLELNAERAKEEARRGTAQKTGGRKTSGRRAPKGSTTGDLLT